MVIFHQKNAFTILNDRTGSEGSEVYTRAHLHTLMSWENCVHYYSIMLCSIYPFILLQTTDLFPISANLTFLGSATESLIMWVPQRPIM